MALGTGTAIAVSCDFVIAANDGLLGVPELTVGLMGGARDLARFVPEPIVRCMYFRTEPCSGRVPYRIRRGARSGRRRGACTRIRKYAPE